MPLPLASVLAVFVLGLAPRAPALQQADAARLVPADAALLVRVESTHALNELVRAFAPLAGDEAASFDLQGALAQAAARGTPGGPVPELDPRLPLYFALSFDAGGGGAARTLVVPVVNDALTFLGPLLGESKTARLGSYVGASTRMDYAASAAPSPLVAGLRPGVVAAHVDLARLVATYRPVIEMGLRQIETSLDQMPDDTPFDPEPLMERFLALGRSMLDTARSLDLALEREGQELALRFDYTEAAERPSPGRAGDVGPLLGYVDPASVMQLAFNGAWTETFAEFEDLFDAVLEVYPEPLRGDFQKLLDAQRELGPLIEPGLVMGLDLGPDGMRGAYVLRSTQPARLVDALESMLRALDHDGGFLRVGASERTSAGGLDARVLPLELRYEDLQRVFAQLAERANASTTSAKPATPGLREAVEAIYGRDLRVAFATKGQLVFVSVAAGAANLRASLERLAAPGTPSPVLTRLFARLEPGSVGFVYHLDLSRMAGRMFEAMRAWMPASTPDLPTQGFSIDYFGARREHTWSGGAVIGISDLIEYVRSMEAVRTR